MTRLSIRLAGSINIRVATSAAGATLAWVVALVPSPATEAQLRIGYHLASVWESAAAQTALADIGTAAGLDAADDGSFYLVDRGDSTVYHMVAGGPVLGSWSASASVGQPLDVALLDDYAVVVGDAGAQIRHRDGSPVAEWASTGATGVAVDTDGCVYVARTTADGGSSAARIDVRSLDGTLLESWQASLPIAETFGIDVAPDGRVYLAADGAVYVFEGGDVVGLLRPPPGPRTAEVLDVEVTTDHDVLAILGNGVLAVWDPGDPSPTHITELGVAQAHSLAIAPGDRLMVSCGEAGVAILPKWQSADTFILKRGIGPPFRIATSPTGEVHVLDNLRRTQTWSADGVVTDAWAARMILEPDPFGGRPEWRVPLVLDVASAGPAFCSLHATELLCFDGERAEVAKLGTEPAVWMAAADGDGTHLAVADYGSQQILVADLDGSRVAGWPLDSQGAFASITDIALDGDIVYAASPSARRIERRNLRGVFLGEIEAPFGTRRIAAAEGVLFALSADDVVWRTAESDQMVPVHDATSCGGATDIAVGSHGRLFVACPSRNAILVLDPGGEPPDQQSVGQPRCDIRADKSASPTAVTVGDEVRIDLAVTGSCPQGSISAVDIVLALGRANDWSPRWGDDYFAPLNSFVQEAALAFLQELEPSSAQVAIVSFGERPDVRYPLTSDFKQIAQTISNLPSTGGTCPLVRALDSVSAELDEVANRSDIPDFALLVATYSSETAGAPDAADRIKARGATLATVSIGASAPRQTLSQIAADPGLNAHAADRAGATQALRSMVSRLSDGAAVALLHHGTITDILPSDMELVEGSTNPAAVVSGNTIVWQLATTPSAGTNLTYRVRPQREGRRPTNSIAWLDYVDAIRHEGTAVFPVPHILVTSRARLPLYLPLTLWEHCDPTLIRADVVLVIDTSSSMAGTKLQDAKEAAITFVRLMDLAPERDQVAVVRFDGRAEAVSELTVDQAAVERAIRKLETRQGTHIDLGLTKALKILRSPRHTPRNTPVIVLLTDGIHTGTPGAERVAAREVRKAAIRLYAIGLGSDVDEPTLIEMAGTTSRYYFAPDSSRLKDIYAEAAHDIDCPPADFWGGR